MKKHSSQALIGALALILGCVIFLTALIGLTTANSRVVVTDADRLRKAESCERTLANLHKLVVPQIDDVVAYYHQRAAQAEDEALRQRYAEREALFSGLYDELSDNKPLSDETHNTLYRMQSIDGTDFEVTPLNILQNTLSLLIKNQDQAVAARAAITTDEATLREQLSQSDDAQQAKAAPWPYYAGMLAGVACMVLGFVLNHTYQMRRVLSQILLYLLLVLGALIMVFPFYWMISSSFKTRIEVNSFPPQFIPGNPFNLDNYRIAFKQAPFARYFLNSIIVCACSVAIVTFTTILAAFAFSRLKFPGREFIFSALLSMMMLPFEMLVITNYTTIIRLNLNDSLPALIIPFISSIFYTYIMRNFFASIPDSLYWSARVDGCSNWRYLWKVMVPIGRPSLVTVVLLNALASWNSFMWPLLVIKTTKNRTLPFGLYAFTTEAGSQQELIMAASTVVVLPMILLFLFARKQILRGVARGGIKG